MRLSEGLRNGLLLLVAVVSGNALVVARIAEPGGPRREAWAPPRAGCAPCAPGVEAGAPRLRGAQSLDLYRASATGGREEEELMRFVFSPPAAAGAACARPEEPLPMGAEEGWSGPAPLP